MAHVRTFRSKKLRPEHVKLLNEAIRKNVKGGDHNVQITYRKENGEVSKRRIKPLGVKQKDLLLAHCHERNAVRSFKIGRISKMEKSAFWDGFFKRAMDVSPPGASTAMPDSPAPIPINPKKASGFMKGFGGTI